MSYTVSGSTQFLFRGCYHEYEGNALNVVDIELTASVINNNVVYITFPLYCPKCRNQHNQLGQAVGNQILQEQNQILHWACGHAYTGDIDDTTIRKENFWDPVKDMRFSRTGWTVSHPRWCPDCIYARSFEIYRNHEFIQNGYRGEHQDDTMYQLAWNMGLRQGRIEALSMNNRPPTEPPAPLGGEHFDQVAFEKAVRDFTTLADPDPPPGTVDEIQRRLGDMNVDPITSILSRLAWITILDPIWAAMDQSIDDLSELMNHTALAVNPYTSPFNFPNAFPLQPAAAAPAIDSQVLQNLGAGMEPFPAADLQHEQERDAPEQGVTINYHALWHPPESDPRVNQLTDRLFSYWMEQILTRDVQNMAALRNACQTVYVGARNRGVLYQLSLEQEVLYEPEGESRSVALDRTTMGFVVVEAPMLGLVGGQPEVYM